MASTNVPQVYRQVMDSVIAGVRIDFEEMGIEQNVLEALQQSWESKLAQSNVADFSKDERMAQYVTARAQQAEDPAGESDSDIKVVPRAPVASSSSKAPPKEETDEIGSDLDDSDDDVLENEAKDDVGEDGDLVIALYDKVNRVKNKWKVSLKDGILSVDKKDYLFSKCQGEFEW